MLVRPDRHLEDVPASSPPHHEGRNASNYLFTTFGYPDPHTSCPESNSGCGVTAFRSLTAQPFRCCVVSPSATLVFFFAPEKIDHIQLQL